MEANDVTLDTDLVVRRFLVGIGILALTCFLSNTFGFLDHPERVFDVQRNSALVERLHLAGFAGQLVTGLWLGVALVFEIAPGRRCCLVLWLASVGLFLAPLPSGREDWWLAPAWWCAAAALAAVSRAVDRALARPAPA